MAPTIANVCITLALTFSLCQAQQLTKSKPLPFNIQIATAKVPSLVNSFIDFSPTPKTDLVISSAVTPSIFSLNDAGNLLNANGEIAIRRNGSNTRKAGIDFGGTATGAALECSIDSTNGPIRCHSGKARVFIACEFNSTAYQVFLKNKTAKLQAGCGIVTLKTSTAG